jgi:hypothetical protein
MSFDPLIQALKENPALAEELRNAKTPRERDAILDAHGIEKPGLDSQFPEAGGVLELFEGASGDTLDDKRGWLRG